MAQSFPGKLAFAFFGRILKSRACVALVSNEVDLVKTTILF
jgi:hypothetical protein